MPTSNDTGQQQIIQRYFDFLSRESRAPTWVYQFANEQNDIKEEDFYEFFTDINDLEQVIWEEVCNRTLTILHEDSAYSAYNSHEKLLSYYFTLIEVLSEHDHAYRLILRKIHLPAGMPRFLSKFKANYLSYISELITKGFEEELIADRIPLSSFYKDGLWLQCFFVLQYWKNDHSEDSSQTDAAIEKAVNLSFELMGSNAVDSMISFGKFLYQSWTTK